MRRSLLIPLLVLGLTSLVHADRYIDSKRGWSIEVPPGWSRISDVELQALNEVTRAESKDDDSEYVGGFRTAKDGYPYVLIHLHHGDLVGSTWRDIEKGFEIAKTTYEKEEGQRALGEMTSGTSLSGGVMDRANGRVFMTIDQTDEGVKTKILSVFHLMKTGVMGVNCYDTAKAFGAHKTEFDLLVNSFRVPDGTAYNPDKDSHRGSAYRYGRTGGIGLGIGLLLVVLRVVRRLFLRD